MLKHPTQKSVIALIKRLLNSHGSRDCTIREATGAKLSHGKLSFMRVQTAALVLQLCSSGGST